MNIGEKLQHMLQRGAEQKDPRVAQHLLDEMEKHHHEIAMLEREKLAGMAQQAPPPKQYIDSSSLGAMNIIGSAGSLSLPKTWTTVASTPYELPRETKLTHFSVRPIANGFLLVAGDKEYFCESVEKVGERVTTVMVTKQLGE